MRADELYAFAKASVVKAFGAPAFLAHLADDFGKRVVLFLHGLKDVPDFIELGAGEGFLDGLAFRLLDKER